MKPIPKTENALVLRTDFSDDLTWEAICVEIQKPAGIFSAYVEFLNNSEYDGITLEQLLTLTSQYYHYTFMFVVDTLAINDPEHPVLVINLFEEGRQTFRVIPSSLYIVENNLSIANMDFEEFEEYARQNGGIYREFDP